MSDTRAQTSEPSTVVFDEAWIEQADLGLDEILGNLAHELRNPLASLQGCAQTMAERGDDLSPEVRDRMTDVILKQSERMDWLVRATAALARPGIGGDDRIDLGRLAADAADTAGVAASVEGSGWTTGSEARLRLALEAVLLALGGGATSIRVDPGGPAVEVWSSDLDVDRGGRRWKFHLAGRLLRIDGGRLELQQTDEETRCRLVFRPVEDEG